jgi:hypothetical protein
MRKAMKVNGRRPNKSIMSPRDRHPMRQLHKWRATPMDLGAIVAAPWRHGAKRPGAG